MSRPLAGVIEAAIAEGVLPPGTKFDPHAERPWPVTLLTAFGAWLAAIPLLAAFFFLVGEVLFRGVAPYLLGLAALAAAIALLRRASIPLFLEQMAVPILLTGFLALGIALFRDTGGQPGAAITAAFALAVGWAVPQRWLRIILGAAGCALTVAATGDGATRLLPEQGLPGLLFAAGAWFLSRSLPAMTPLKPDAAGALGAMSDGWVVATLAGLAFWSGMTFLAGASIDPFHGDLGAAGTRPYGMGAGIASMLLALGAAAWIRSHWPSLRAAWSAVAAAVLLALAALMPSLGAVLLLLAVCCTQGRWRLAGAAGIAAAWIVGAFYYQLAYPLATKAAIMIAAGAVCGVVAWMAPRSGGGDDGARVPANPARARLGIAACALAVLAVANAGIWQKEQLIAHGKTVYVELGPVDPRSLMQGDYMRIAFQLPRPDRSTLTLPGAQRPRAIGKIDARGVLALERIDDGTPLAPGEMAVELTPARSGWTLVTDAWYFREGDAARWERARFGEFRVTPDGRALLVGMRGPQLEPLLTP